MKYEQGATVFWLPARGIKVVFLILCILVVAILILGQNQNEVQFQYSISLSETSDHYLWAHYSIIINHDLQENGLTNIKDNSTLFIEYNIQVIHRGENGINHTITGSGYRNYKTGIFFRTLPIDITVGLYDYNGLINVTGFEPVQIRGAMKVTKEGTRYHIAVFPSEIPPQSVWDTAE